jgi:AmiR/NasT family two-component response regulator
MNFYATSTGAFDDLDVRVGSILATFAALAVEAELHERDTANLEAALRTNRLIGMAIGIVMATERVTEDDAFGLLRQASNHLNRKLVDIAEHVHLTGSLPTPPTRS